MQTVLTAQMYKDLKNEIEMGSKRASETYAYRSGGFRAMINYMIADMKVLENRIAELENQIEKLEQEKELVREREQED